MFPGLHPSATFLTVPPDWTLEGVSLPCDDIENAVLEQHPFRWINGLWEAETVVARAFGSPNPPHVVLIRIAPDTLRRWKDLAIDPLIEACAQLKDHLLAGALTNQRSVLTLL